MKAITSNAVFDALAGKEDGYPTYKWNNSSSSTYWWNCLVFAVSRASNSTQVQGGVFQFYTFGEASAAAGSFCEVLIELKCQNGAVSYTAQMTKGSSTSQVRINYYSGGDGYNYLHVIPYVGNYSYAELRVIKNDGCYAINPSGVVTNSYTGVLYPNSPTPPDGDNSTNVANTEWVNGRYGMKSAVVDLSTSQTLTPAAGRVYYISVGTIDVTLSNSPTVGTRCYIQVKNYCPQSSRLLFTDVAGNSNVVDFGTGYSSSGGVMCERFASGWMVVGGMSQT